MQPDANSRHQRLGDASFSLGNRAFRALWNVTWITLASWTPPPLHRWRNILLRCFGAKLHPSARVYASARVWYPPNLSMDSRAVLGPRVICYCQGEISLGENVVVSQGAHLCAGTHDISDPNFRLITRAIVIKQDAWVAAEAFVGPGVTVGEGAVVGARAVVFRQAEPWGVYAGNPAQRIKTRVFRT